MSGHLPHVLRLAAGERDERTNRHLAYLLAWVAGALNSVGFVAVGFYTSHMTGIVATVADQLVLGGTHLVLFGLVALVAFVLGAMACAHQFNWARRRHRRDRFALVLFVEAVLILIVGALAEEVTWVHREWLIVATLGFVMGQQNALITKVSDATIRTTHITGMVTDIGIELGKMTYLKRAGDPDPVRGDLRKLLMLSTLVALFFVGGVLGALGYLAVGFPVLLVPAVLLLAVAVPPLVGGRLPVGDHVP
ncbi:YoaK family protein [Ornithinimicrobium sufpigmenti]|uniref:YoaK family protein n=1 Tax=Ornithinimicrobium sufpigmenti TaxID=2508882 RepID=UPI0010365D94|nr:MULTISPECIES: YoaK family protein [unclassified Ornithinimicrobium]